MSGFVPSTSALGANPDIEATESKYNYPTDNVGMVVWTP